MSRNLCKILCDFCDSAVVLDETPRPISPNDTGPRMFDEYSGMVVANATCTLCEAKYLAWITFPARWRETRIPERPFYDLSFRDSFNDEPGDADLPTYKITWEHIAHKEPFDRASCPYAKEYKR